MHLARVIILVLGTLGLVAPAAEGASRFRDPEDGSFDMSHWLSSTAGFFPYVGLITEPAVGFGLSGGPVFLSDPFRQTPDGDVIPPNIAAAFGFFTENGSWGAGGAYFGVLGHDRIRGLVGAAYAKVKLTTEIRGFPLDYTIEGPLVSPGFKARIKNSRVFVGLDYRYLDFDLTLDNPTDREELESIFPITVRARTAGVGASIGWDDRDSIFTPNRGIVATSEIIGHGEAVGGAREYWKLHNDALAFHPVRENWVLAVHGVADLADDTAPFWDQPSVGMRGINAGRYRGTQVLSCDAEVRWDLDFRWSVVGFGGVGRASVSSDLLGTHTDVVGAGGTGFRYFLARDYQLRGGVDVAYGPEKWSVYITAGSAWGGL